MPDIITAGFDGFTDDDLFSEIERRDLETHPVDVPRVVEVLRDPSGIAREWHQASLLAFYAVNKNTGYDDLLRNKGWRITRHERGTASQLTLTEFDALRKAASPVAYLD